MTNKLKPGLIAGAALGLLLVFTVLISAIPFLRLIGCCNCLWPIAGGLLATMLYVKGSPVPATILDGANLGVLTGVIGGLIYLVIGLPIAYLVTGVEAIDAQIRQLNPDFPLSGMVVMVVGGVVGFVVFVVLSTIGGLVGVPIFEKRKANVGAQPPPQDFGGGPTGPYGGR